MRLNHLIIEQYARIPYAEFSFGKCNPIVGKGAWRLAGPLGVLVGNRFADVLPTPYAFCKDSRFYAAFEADGVQYSAEAVYDENAPRHSRVQYFCGGAALGEEKVCALFHLSDEEDASSFLMDRYDAKRCAPCFEFDQSLKLYRYRRALAGSPQAFSAQTDGVSETQTFRRVLRSFCDGFSPMTVSEEKKIVLVLDRHGRFIARKEGARCCDLSASESALKQLLAFLAVNEFWGQVQRSRGRIVQKPLFIMQVPDRIDDAVDLTPFMERACATGRQVFIFSDRREMHLSAGFLRNTIEVAPRDP